MFFTDDDTEDVDFDGTKLVGVVGRGNKGVFVVFRTTWRDSRSKETETQLLTNKSDLREYKRTHSSIRHLHTVYIVRHTFWYVDT